MLEIHLAGKTIKKRQNSDLHTPSQFIASPLHIKQRNQEGCHTARCQLLTSLGKAEHQVS
jgi:hypothetical protein